MVRRIHGIFLGLCLLALAQPAALLAQAPTDEEIKAQEQAIEKKSTAAGGIEMVDIPGKNFRMGKYDVTFAQWDACVTAGGCGGYNPSDEGWGRSNRPVIYVSYDDAHKYIDWLNQTTSQHFRLPTEEEWEYAARGGTTTDYYWGNDIGSGNANCNGCGSQWDNKQTAPVGSFKPNPYGLYDMLGNVWQWTESCWENNCGQRVFCGGSWHYLPRSLRDSGRAGPDPGPRSDTLGFRFVQDK
jgi:formylglycine-generating enzyme required for sulfatase activity